MKALRMSPISRRQENSSYGGSATILQALHRRLCMELELCVATAPRRGSCTSAAELALRSGHLQQEDDPEERDVAAAVVLALSALPVASNNNNPSSSCGCVRLSEWLGPATSSSSGSTFGCQSCENVPWPDIERPRQPSSDHPQHPLSPISSSPSLLTVRALIRRGAFREAAELAGVLLRTGADPDETDSEGRSLLSYSVQQLDDCIVLTRLLLNSGASVWHGAPTRPAQPDHSPFSWLLRALILRRRYEHCSLTLDVLARIMGNEPLRMKSLVLRTMFRHARCPRVLGPIFQQVKTALSGYWSQPQGLQYNCWRTLRRALGPSRITSSTPQLGLPVSLEKYLLMEN